MARSTADSTTTEAPAEESPAHSTNPEPSPVPTVDPDRIQHLDHRTVLVDANIRAAHLDREFIASIRRQGVLVPCVAVLTADGHPRARMGNRRTLAAIEAELPTAPYRIIGQEGTDDAATIQRIEQQWAENEHRDGLTDADKIRAVGQLHLLGVSPAQIAKRLGAKRAHVDAAVKVNASPLATGATERYDFLDLTQAAVIAEFEDDPEAVKALVLAAKDGQFDHLAQRLRDRRKAAIEWITREHELRAMGLTIITPPARHEQARPLTSLTKADGELITTAAHQECPGHAAYLYEEWGWYNPATGQPLDDDDESPNESEDEPEREYGKYLGVRYACTDPATHGHQERRFSSPVPAGKPRVADMSEEEREAARDARRDVIASNKAWASAETVRRKWLTRLAARKTAPKGTAAHLITALVADRDMLSDTAGPDLAAQLLGIKAPDYRGKLGGYTDLLDSCNDHRALLVALLVALCAAETSTTGDHWRNRQDRTIRYLRFLETTGYALPSSAAPAARRSIGPRSRTPPDRWATPCPGSPTVLPHV